MKSSGIFRDRHHRLRLIHARLVRLAAAAVDRRRKARAHQHVDAVEDMRALIGHNAARVVGVKAPVAEAVGVERRAFGGPLPLLPIERAIEFGSRRQSGNYSATTSAPCAPCPSLPDRHNPRPSWYRS